RNNIVLFMFSLECLYWLDYPLILILTGEYVFWHISMFGFCIHQFIKLWYLLEQFISRWINLKTHNFYLIREEKHIYC
ncbi:hypothetical protein ACJX0J_036791, partial [Zea mays]